MRCLEMGIYNTKIIESKNFREYIVDINNYTFFGFRKKEVCKRRKFEELSLLEKCESFKRKQKYYVEKRFEIKRLVDCNFDGRSSFFTMTFKDNVQNVNIANARFTNFIKRLKYYLKLKYSLELRYIATWELQKRGAVHYHVLFFNIPFINISKLSELWGFGHCWINEIKDKNGNKLGREKVAIYVTKYFCKDLEKKVNYKKAYFCSRNLKRPSVARKILSEDKIKWMIDNSSTFLYFKIFETKKLVDIQNGKKIFETIPKIYIVEKKVCNLKQKMLKCV